MLISTLRFSKVLNSTGPYYKLSLGTFRFYFTAFVEITDSEKKIMFVQGHNEFSIKFYKKNLKDIN